jgi:hypothetical protein
MNFSIAYEKSFFGLDGGKIHLSVTRNGTTLTQSVTLSTTVSISNCLATIGSYTYPVLEFVNYWPTPSTLCYLDFRSLMPYRGTGNLSATISISNYPGSAPVSIPYAYANNKTMVYGSASSLSNSFQYYIPPSGRPLYGIHCVMKAMSGGSCLHARSNYFPDDNPANMSVSSGSQGADIKTADQLGYYPYNIVCRPALTYGSIKKDYVSYSVDALRTEIASTYTNYLTSSMPAAISVFCFGESTSTTTFNLSMATNGDDTTKWRQGTIPMKSFETYSLTAATGGYDPLITW